MLKLLAKKPLSLVVIIIILLLALFLRVYRIDQLLGFYYDQGRDAMVVWDLLHKHRFFLIGPTTGIEGIFRGPWYYWLITPFYWLGKGNPTWPSIFLSFTTVLASLLAYINGARISGRRVGFLALIISGLAFNLVYASRWLSNPTPMLLISMLLVYFLFLIMEGKKWAWVGVALMLGGAMQFGSAAEIFFFPAVIIFAAWQRRNLPNLAIFLISLAVLLATFLPQIIFDLKHDGVLSTAIKNFLIQKQSFKVSFWQMVQIRLPFYFDLFFAKIFPMTLKYRQIMFGYLLISAVLSWKQIAQNRYIKVVLLMLVSPLVGMLFFQGNYGNVYDYYFTGYYLVFVLLASYFLLLPINRRFGALLTIIFLIFFFKNNYPVTKGYLVAGVDGPTHITLGNELQGVDWVFKNSSGREFNQDVYVPPVIPWAYDYLFLWQASKRCGENLCNMQLSRRIPLLYTLYEVDPPHPERLDAWLARQKGIGKVEESASFGGITVERRTRLEIRD